MEKNGKEFSNFSEGFFFFCFGGGWCEYFSHVNIDSCVAFALGPSVNMIM